MEFIELLRINHVFKGQRFFVEEKDLWICIELREDIAKCNAHCPDISLLFKKKN